MLGPTELQVVCVDFPPTVLAYQHCAGRCHRPGVSGSAVSLFGPGSWHLARELLELCHGTGEANAAVRATLEPVAEQYLEIQATAQRTLAELREGRTAPVVAIQGTAAHKACARDAAAELGLVAAEVRPSGRLHVAAQRELLPARAFDAGAEVQVKELGAGVVVEHRVAQGQVVVQVGDTVQPHDLARVFAAPSPLLDKAQHADAPTRERRAQVAAQLRHYLRPANLDKDMFLGPIAKQQRGWVPACWLLKCRKLRAPPLLCADEVELELALLQANAGTEAQKERLQWDRSRDGELAVRVSP